MTASSLAPPTMPSSTASPAPPSSTSSTAKATASSNARSPSRKQEAREIYLDRFRAIHLDRLAALPDREAMLRSLVETGIYLGVVSNKTGPLLRREVERLGWSRFFGSVVGAGDAAADKPSCEPVHLALSESG